MDKKKIIIIEDERDLANVLKDYLSMHNYEVLIAGNGVEGLKIIDSKRIDFIILDINLPDMDGIRICQKIRKTSIVPILILSARKSDVDKVVALGFGADDYMTKPFSASELVARVNAHLRRMEQIIKQTEEINTNISIGELSINEKSYSVTVKDKDIELSAKEFELLLHLAKHKNQVFTKNQLWDTLWGYEEYGDVNTIAVYIRRLREKIESDPANPAYIKTVWGVGYKISTGET